MAIEATFHDGKTAAAHSVVVRIEPPVLRFISEDGHEITHWPLDAVRLVEKPVPGQVIRLRNGHEADDRLTLPLGRDAAFLAPYCPNLAKGDSAWKKTLKPLVLLGAGSIGTLVLLFLVVVPFLANQLAMHFPESWEVQIGEKAVNQITHMFAFTGKKRPEDMVCKNIQGQNALNQMVERLTDDIDLPIPIRVQVINAGIKNAFALPGGQILIMRGLIDFAETPNELAGVLAHEIGHVAHRDPLRMVAERSGTAATFGLLFGDIFGGFALAGMGEALINASYTRDKERAADDMGVVLMNKAGFDGTGLAAFLERLKKKEGDTGGLMGFFASHPAFDDRSAAVRDSAESGGAALTDAEWRAIREMCPKRR